MSTRQLDYTSQFSSRLHTRFLQASKANAHLLLESLMFCTLSLTLPPMCSFR